MLLVRLEPDLSWWVSDRCVFVGDVKYKRAAANRASNADVYQMLAYMEALGLRECLLVYAEGDGPSLIRLVGGRTIHLHKVRLLSEHTSLEERLERVARTIRALREG